MRESVVRWVVHITALIMAIGIPIVIGAFVVAHRIPLMKLAFTNPLLLIPYALVYAGWGEIWDIIAANWVLHGSIGIRRFTNEFINNKKLRRIVNILIIIFILIEGLAMVYSLIAVPL
ncbi:MAG: succinate dehydrogenase [Vulcanisaeta sp.]|nr:succinate dehydrogenase [Vulcanisaeta sp.]MCG2869701.1 succinate dehydrogenase [Vulcanisaeta sp.]MCG2886987.1 succinate dehydrogenase [Vulcanisaeta sp.]